MKKKLTSQNKKYRIQNAGQNINLSENTSNESNINTTLQGKLTDGYPCSHNDECISDICKNNMIGQGKCEVFSHYDDASKNISNFASKLGNTVTNIGNTVATPFKYEPVPVN